MALFPILISCAIAALGLAAIVHSFFGEKLLIGPLLAKRGNSVLEHELARMLIRFAWHVTSLMWIIMAIILYALSFSPKDLPAVIFVSFGVGFLTVGIFDLIASRAKHIGWPVLTAIGGFCLGAYFIMDMPS